MSNVKIILADKDNRYTIINSQNAVEYTYNIEQATDFLEKGAARKMLNRCTKKLHGFTIREIPMDGIRVEAENVRVVEEDQEIQNVHEREERIQFSMDIKASLYAKSKGKCAICGKPILFSKMTVDHIVPLAGGGTNDISNLQTACRPCNAFKADLYPTDFADKLFKMLQKQMKQSNADPEDIKILKEIRGKYRAKAKSA